MIKRYLVIFFFSAVAIVFSRKSAPANGAVFQRGSESSTPIPIKQSELYLKKEHVVFKNDEVVARFWVQNPSDRDIVVKMGFPLSHGHRYDSGDTMDADKIAFLGKTSSDVRITSGEKAFKLEMNEQDKGPYRVTFLWDMVYPAGKLTEITVECPMDRTWGSADGYGENAEFTYITHTGASWAQPIEEAVFEYYDRGLVDFITTFYPGVWWEDEKTQLDVRYVVSPQPYTIDINAGKIVWRRTNWVPRKNKDDIRISVDWKYNVGAPGVDTHMSDPSSFGLLCGFEYDKDDSGSKHFAETTKLESVKYDKISFEYEIFYKAEIYRDRHAAYPAITEHMRLASKLEVLKYLRNFIAARHGHVFQDDELSECYRNVKLKKSWSDAEKGNLQLIQDLEKTISQKYKIALAQIKDDMLDMELLRNAMFGWQGQE